MNFSRNTNISDGGCKTTQFRGKFVPNICVTSEQVGTMWVTRRDMVTLRVTITVTEQPLRPLHANYRGELQAAASSLVRNNQSPSSSFSRPIFQVPSASESK